MQCNAVQCSVGYMQCSTLKYRPGRSGKVEVEGEGQGEQEEPQVEMEGVGEHPGKEQVSHSLEASLLIRVYVNSSSNCVALQIPFQIFFEKTLECLTQKCNPDVHGRPC